MLKLWPTLLILYLLVSTTGWAASPPLLIPSVIQPFLAHPQVQRVTTDAQHVFVLSGGQLRSFNAALVKINWAVPLKSYGGLTVGAGVVVVDNGFDALLAYDALTGKQRWRSAASRPLTWGGNTPVQTPLSRLQVAGHLVVAASSNDVRAWDARTGALRWRVAASDPGWLGVSGNVVTFTARSGVSGYVKAVHRLDGTPVWTLHPGLVGEVVAAAGGHPYLYAVQRFSTRPRLQLVDVRTGKNVVVEYRFPRGTNIETFLQRETICALTSTPTSPEIQCVPRTSGRYVSGEKSLLPVLKAVPPGPALWEQQVRRMGATSQGTWLLGGLNAVLLQRPRGDPGCASLQTFAQVSRFAVARITCGSGKGRLAVIDQQAGTVVALVMAHGEVTAAHLLQQRLIIVTDRDVLSLLLPH